MTATPDFYAWIAVFLCTIEVVRRTPAAIRTPKSRTLWYVFLALDLALATKIQIVGSALYHLTGVDDFATLAKHLIGIVAVAGLLRWITRVVPGREDGKPEPRYRMLISSTPRRIVTWAAVIVITAVFPLAQRRTGNQEDADFIFVQAGHFWGSLHLLLFYAYLVFGMTCTSMMCADASREPSAGTTFRHGMQAVSAGCVTGAVYGIVRSGFLTARLFDKPFLGGPVFVDTVSNFALTGCLLLVVGGCAAPFWERTSQRIRAHRAINDLRPLWGTLTAAAPTVIYTPRHTTRLPSFVTALTGRLYDFWNWKHLDLRLSRRINEICDVSLILTPYVPADLRARTQAVVAELGLSPYVVPAYLLHTALQSKQTQQTPADGHPDTAILQAGADLLSTTERFLPVGKAMRNSALMKLINRKIKTGVTA